MNSIRPPRWKILAAFAAIYFIWGSTFLAIRVAVRTIPPLLLGGSRFLLAGTLLYAWSEFRRAPRASLLHWRSALVIGLLLLFGGHASILKISRFMNSGTIALFASMIPLWMALLQAVGLGGRRPRAMTWFGIVVGIAGIVVLARPGTGGNSHPFAVLALAAGCLSWAFGSVLSPRLPHAASPARATAMQMLCGGAALTIAGLLAGEGRELHLESVTPEAVFSLLYLALAGSVVAFSAYVWLLRVCAPTLVGTYAFVNPVVAVIVGALIGGERLDPRVGFAGALIVTAVAILTLAPGRTAEAPARRDA